MAEPSPITVSRAERLDSLCDRFEQEWVAGAAPRIETYLTTVPEAEREELWRGLLLVECELLIAAGQQPDPSTYRQRFPQYADQIESLLAEVPQTRSGVRATGQTALMSAPGVDTSIGSKTPAASSSEPPKQLGRFEILDALGEGAFGTVYRARDPHLDREVAIKLPRDTALRSTEDRERFLREARAAANLNHPNICPVHEVGELDGREYIVMAYLPGKPLSKIIESGKVQARHAAAAIRKLALALQEAHAKGIVHRDLKPANIMINTRGEPIVMDFGLARLQKTGDAQLTQSGVIMGSPAYMSPEQARGDTDAIGPATDIYSLGVVLYELLTGRRPFEGTVTEVIGKILHVPPEPPSAHRKSLDAGLEAICLKAMAKNPAERFGSMKEFAAALGDWLKKPSSTTGSAAASVAEPAAPPSEGIDETQRFAQLFAALASEQKSQTAAAVDAALQKHLPHRSWLIAAGVLGFLILLGIVFFVRRDTVTVVIQIPIENLHDPALSFVLDDKPISADELSVPIELKPGEHELVVNRDGSLFRKFRFRVGKEQDEPVVVQDVTPTPPEPPKAVTAKTPLDLLDPSDIPAKERFPWQPRELVAVFGEHRSTHWGTVQTIAVSPDDRIVASAGEEGFIHLSDPQTLERVGTLTGHIGRVHAIAFVPKHDQIISAGADGTLRLWDITGRRELRKLTGHTGPVHTVAVLPDGTRALSGGSDASIRLWDLASGQELRKFDKSRWAVWKVVVAADGRRVLSGGGDRKMRFWDLQTGDDLVQFDIEKPGLHEFKAIGLSPDGSRAFSGTSEVPGLFSSMRVWDTATGKEIRRADEKYRVANDGHGVEITRANAVAYSPDGRQVLTGIHSPADGNDLILWDGRNGDVIRRFGMQATWATAVAFSPDGRRAYTGSAYGRLRAWDIETGKDLAPFPGHESFLSSVSLAPDGLRLLTGGEDMTVRLWDTLNGQKELQVYRAVEPSTTYCSPWQGCFSPTGDRALFFGGRRTSHLALLWDPVAWNPIAKFPKRNGDQPVYLMMLSPEGRKLIDDFDAGPPASTVDASLPSPLGHWTFEDAPLGDDVTGRFRSARHVGKVSASPGRFGNGLQIAVADVVAFGAARNQQYANPGSWLEFPFDDRLNLQQFSLAGWVKVGPETVGGRVIGWSDDSGSVTLNVSPTAANVAVRFGAGGTGETERKARITGDFTQWTHVAGVYDGRTLALYVNGRKVKEAAEGRRLPTFHSPLAIGLGLVATLDEVRMYDVPLTAEQVAALAAVGSAPPGLVLDDGHSSLGLINSERAVGAGHDRRISDHERGPVLVRLFDRRDGRELKTIAPFKGFMGLAISAEHIAVANRNTGHVNLYDTELNGERRLGNGIGPAMAFSPNGATFATANQQGHVALWSPATGQKLREWKFPGAVYSVGFDQTGGYLVTGNANGTAYLLRLGEPGQSQPAVVQNDSRDRQAAEWVLKLGGWVQIDVGGQRRVARTLADLPQSPFKVTQIETEWKTFPGSELRQMEGLTALQYLWVRNADISDNDLRHVRGLSELVEIGLDGTHVTDAGLVHLLDLPNLHNLHLARTQVTDAGLARLKGLKLHILGIDHTSVGDAGLKHVSEIRTLNALWATGTNLTDAGLRHLAKLPNLEHISLAGTQVTDQGLAALKPLKLRGLSLQETQITDAGLTHLKGMNLNWLGLADTRVTDAGLEHLREMKSLTSLYLGRAEITDRGLAALVELDELHDLHLDGTPVTNAGLPHLARLRKLLNLNLSHTRVSDAGVISLRTLRSLRQLHLHGTRVTPAGLRALKDALPDCEIYPAPPSPSDSDLVARIERMGGKITRDNSQPARPVIGIDFYSATTKPSDALLAELQQFPELRTLNLWGSDQITDDGLRALRKLGSLRSLDLGVTRIGDLGIANLEPLRQLDSLNLSYTQTTDAALKCLTAWPELRRLGLDSVPITDDGLATLVGLKELRHLNLLSTRVQGPGLKHLAGMRHLEQLWLSNSPVGDEGLRALVSLESLNQLFLTNTRVTDAGLRHLASCRALVELELFGTPVTPAGLEHLTTCTTLKTLRVDNRQINDRARTRLEAANPQLQIVVSANHDSPN